MDYLIKIYYLINGEAELIEEQWHSRARVSDSSFNQNRLLNQWII